MLAEFIQPLGNYLYEVFVVRLDGWAVLGFLAQALFSARFLIQWIVSERARRSVIPVAFWWFSIAGGALLFVYSLHRRDPVFIIGQGGGLFIYIRNVMLVLREQRGEPTPV
jgi:lipid-A-disaccharide synthase-like uncharacterized protein